MGTILAIIIIVSLFGAIKIKRTVKSDHRQWFHQRYHHED